MVDEKPRRVEQGSERIFISYSRKDGGDFAAELRKRLTAEGLSIWQDLVQMEGGRDWWSQIETAIRSKDMEHFVLVVTRQALDADNGKIIRQEIRLARQEGKTVSPVRGPGIDDLGKLPRWFGHVYDIGIPEQFTRLLLVLHGPSTQKRMPMQAPEPPSDFVARPAHFAALKAKLLDPKGDAVAITAALKGAGGYGKTTLARALAHDPDVQDAYFDGILWVELGEKPHNLLGIVADRVTALTGTPPGFSTVDAAATALGEALGNRRILLVVDDVWRTGDLHPFLQGGPNTTRLVTTRDDGVLPAEAFRHVVDAMQDNEALALLAAGLASDQVAVQRRDLGKLAGRLGEWPLLLRLVNGFLRDRVVKGREALATAIAGVNERLDTKGFVAFDARNPAERTSAVARTIGVSLELLDETSKVTAARARFSELAVFPEDADVPIGIAARLWKQTAGLDKFDTEDLLSDLSRLSLLLSRDLDRRTFRLHDTIRQFLCDMPGKDGLIAQHRQLVGALDSIGAAPQAVDDLTRRYFYLNLPHHLADAGERIRLDALLNDPTWLKAKLEAIGNPTSLVLDYERYGDGELQNFIGRTLRLAAGICARDQRQLIPQLLARIMGCKAAATESFLEAARLQLSPPAIITQRLSLTPPGAEIARLEGHTDWIRALCVLPDGRLASGSRDNTIRLWDVNAGVETARLEGHLSSVEALCVLPDGRLASGSGDHTIRLWDVATTGAEPASLKGHSSEVTALCMLPDGRLASGSGDRTIRLWDVASGAEAGRLVGHVRGVTALCLLPDGRLASGSWDHTILLWDIISSAEPERLDVHSLRITALCMLRNGRLASGSDDRTIRLWDIASGATTRIVRHSGEVTALKELPDGRLASGSGDSTIRLWDAATGTETAKLEGHSGCVTALCTLPDGRLASGSGDSTIRLWDAATGTETARLGHTGWVGALCELPNGRLASGSEDKTIRLWDVTSGSETARLERHSKAVAALCLLPDVRLASGSWDHTILLWDITSSAEPERLDGHSWPITALCMLRDGRLASGSNDNTIRLWSVTNPDVHAVCLEGHSDGVAALCVLPDGRLASGSEDKTIRLWDVTTGAETGRLDRHFRGVTALCLLPDSRLASGSKDRTILLWDIRSGAEPAGLEGHSDGVTALCVLPDGRLVSGSRDHTIRLWDPTKRHEVSRLEVDAAIVCLIALRCGYLVAGDHLGRLHWLEVVD